MPEEVVIAIVAYATEGELILTAAEAAAIVAVVTTVAATIYAQKAQREALAAARDAYNSSLRDRYIMTRGASEPRQVVLGRVRTSGPMFFVGSYGPSREHLTFLVALASHEIDAVEQIYFDDMPVTLDGSGNVLGVQLKETFTIATTGGTFTINNKARTGTVVAQAVYGSNVVALGVSVAGTSITVSGALSQVGVCEIRYIPDPSPFNPNPIISVQDSVVLDAGGNGSVTVAHTPIPTSVFLTNGTGSNWSDLTASTSVSGNVITVSGSPTINSTVPLQYQYIDTTPRARVRVYLGAPGETADAQTIANFPGVWTSAHVAKMVAKLVVELDYDPTAFPSGLPNVSARVRGAKVYDPRTGLTAWSDNPALLTRAYVLSPVGGRLTSDLVNDADIIVAANVCDTTSTFVVNGQSYTRPLYRAGTVAKSTARPTEVITDLVQSMGGKWVFNRGKLRVKAGSYVTPLQTLDETWLSDKQGVHVQPQRDRSDVFNAITCSYADEAQNYQVVPMPRLAPPAYIAEDGAELPLDLTLASVQFSGQAQYIASCMLRDSRLPLQLTVLCNMRAYCVEVFDVIYVSLARFGFVKLPCEVLDRQWTIEGGIQLSLKITDPSIFTIDAAYLAFDAGKQTRLPSPFKVADVAGLTVTSGGGVMLTQSDGTVLQRLKAVWTAAADPGILDSNGGFEIRYGLASLPDSQWRSEFPAGNLTEWFLPDVLFNRIYAVKIRGFNAIATGNWSAQVFHKVGGVSIVVDTPQLAANAATDFAKATPADGTRTTSTYSGAPATLFAAHATLNYTNTGAAAVEVEVFGSFTWWVSVAAAGYVIGASFQGTNGATNITDANNVGITGTSAPTPVSYSRSFSVAAGATLSINLSSWFKTAGSGASGGVFNWTDMILKYNVLKR